MSSKTRRASLAQKIQSTRNSQDSSEALENSQNSLSGKPKSKNYSAEESKALIKCAEKFHTIISLNSSRDKDKKDKEKAWEKIKVDFHLYCKSQGIFVSCN